MLICDIVPHLRQTQWFLAPHKKHEKIQDCSMYLIFANVGKPPHYLGLQKYGKSAYVRDEVAKIGQKRPKLCNFGVGGGN